MLKKEKKENFDKWYALSLVGQVGYTVAVPLVIFVVAGAWADEKLATKPTLTLAGLVIGMISSFVALYKLLKRFLKK